MLDHFNRAMRHFFISLFLIACVVASTGAAAKTLPSSLTPSVRDVNDSDTDNSPVYKAVEQMPRFPGGEGALMTYIARNIRYPNENAEGSVIVQFVVTKIGSIGKVKVVRSGGPELDREAIRVIKTLPKFIPGIRKGEPVNVWYTLPITFKIQK